MYYIATDYKSQLLLFYRYVNAIIILDTINIYRSYKMVNKRQSATKPKWYKRKWVWAVAVVLVVIVILSPSEEAQKSADSKTESKSTAQQANAPSFDEYLNKSMSEVATEFGQAYDPANSRQIKAEKNGYQLLFEDGGVEDSADPLKTVPTGKVTTTSITLPELGKCQFKDVYAKTDEAMKIVGLDPSTKGDKAKGSDGTKSGDAEYENYLGKESIRLVNRCAYEGASYQLMLTVGSGYRYAE